MEDARTSMKFYMFGREGIENALPRGGSNAANPAWRRAVVHAGMS